MISSFATDGAAKAIGIALLAGLGIGIVNGIGVAIFRVNPLIMRTTVARVTQRDQVFFRVRTSVTAEFSVMNL